MDFMGSNLAAHCTLGLVFGDACRHADFLNLYVRRGDKRDIAGRGERKRLGGRIGAEQQAGADYGAHQDLVRKHLDLSFI
jgi:hypothetical protein